MRRPYSQINRDSGVAGFFLRGLLVFLVAVFFFEIDERKFSSIKKLYIGIFFLVSTTLDFLWIAAAFLAPKLEFLRLDREMMAAM